MHQRWFSRRAITLHTEFAVLVAGCGAATWWQATTHWAGISSAVYTFEWPILGIIALAGWWHLVHEDPEKFPPARRNSMTGSWTRTSAKAPRRTEAQT